MGGTFPSKVSFFVKEFPKHSKGWLGHIWIKFEENTAYGFNINGIGIQIFKDHELYNLESAGTTIYSFHVEENSWEKGYFFLKSYTNKKTIYGLDVDCVLVVEKIAKAIGLNIPLQNLIRSPTEWLEDL